MRNFSAFRVAALLLGISLHGGASAAGTAEASVKQGGSSTVEAIAGTQLKRVTLSAKAAKRLAIKTGKMNVDAGGVMTAPYAALIYDRNGETWVYTNPEPLVFVRAPVVVETINGNDAILKQGPEHGTVVVVVGVAELYGAETGVGK